MVEGGMKCVKYMLFLFNLIFFLAGLGLIIVGAVVQAKFNDYFSFFGDSFSGAAILLIVVGSVIFIIGFFGCCGAYKENYCMTMTFAVLLLIIFILEIAAGITAYALRHKVRGFVEQKLHESIDGYGKSDDPAITKSWDQAQTDFQCCGVNNYTDWSASGAKLPDGALPDSCCKENTEGCGAGMLTNFDSDKMNSRGCVSGFEEWVQDNIIIVGGVGIGLAFVQLFGIMIACCLAKSIKKEYQVV
jgi:CD63 antigen